MRRAHFGAHEYSCALADVSCICHDHALDDLLRVVCKVGARAHARASVLCAVGGASLARATREAAARAVEWGCDAAGGLHDGRDDGGALVVERVVVLSSLSLDPTLARVVVEDAVRRSPTLTHAEHLFGVVLFSVAEGVEVADGSDGASILLFTVPGF